MRFDVHRDHLMEMSNAQKLPEKACSIIIFTILAIYPIVGMGVDLLAPALPGISSQLQVSSSITKNLISTYLLGYAIGNFFIGFLSDALGRRPLLLMGIAIFVIVSLIPTFFPNIIILLLVRFFQGATLASLGVVGRAVFADILPQEKLLQVAVLISTMWGLGPILGPVIGGYLQFYFGWQSCFYFFAIFGLIGLIAFYFFVPETLLNRQVLSVSQIQNNLKSILTHRAFMGMVLLMGLAYALLITFNTLGPFLIQSTLGFSSIYFGHIALILGVVFLIATFICRELVKKFPVMDIILYTIAITFIITIVSCFFAASFGKNIWSTIIPSLLMFFACGIIYPAALGYCISSFRHIAGTAAAMMILFNFLISTLVATLMSFVNGVSAFDIVGVYFLIMLFSACIYLFLLPKTTP